MVIKKMIALICAVSLILAFVPQASILVPGLSSVIIRSLFVPLIGIFLVQVAIPRPVGIIRVIIRIFLTQIILFVVVITIGLLKQYYHLELPAPLYFIRNIASWLNLVWFWPLLIIVIALAIQNKKTAALSTLSKRQLFFFFSGLVFILSESYVLLASASQVAYLFSEASSVAPWLYFTYLLVSVIAIAGPLIFLFSRKNNNL